MLRRRLCRAVGACVALWPAAAAAAPGEGSAPRAPVPDGLVLWLEAADLTREAGGEARSRGAPAPRSVASWPDRSPGRLRAVQGSPDRRPTLLPGAINARPAVRFDGDDFLSLGRAEALRFGGGRGFTIAVVYRVAARNCGTFIALGAADETRRAYQLYAAPGRVGAVAFGRRSESRAQPGANLAVQVCAAGRSHVYLNGRKCLSLAAGQGRCDVDVLVGARRKGADNTGIGYPLTGEIAELLVYGRALSGGERSRLRSHLMAKYGLGAKGPSAPRPAGVEALLAKGDRLSAAERLWNLAQQNRLTGAHAAVAGGLLDCKDPFVRGLAEWALAMKVGGENNGQAAVWPKDHAPPWFAQWLRAARQRRVEADWVRQAVAGGLHRDAAKLSASVGRMVRRAERMAADFAQQPAAGAALDEARRALGGLRAARDALAARRREAPNDAAAARELWLDARRALRRVVLANPAAHFDRIVFVRRHAPHTVRNITRSYPWKHKPGGDICVLSNIRAGDARARPLLEGRLAPGYVWGLDLSFDARKLVFGYARLPRWPPPVNTADTWTEGTHVFELRKLYPPMHLHEIDLASGALRQLTKHPYWSDFEPTYCAGGEVVFASDRCARSAECGHELYDHANPNLYVLSADRRTVRRLTDNKDIDRYPHALDDGRIAYTHWEYQERHFMEVHAIWTVRPDGRSCDALFKHHMSAPCGLRDARSIPRSRKLVAVATGHHTFAYGPVVIVDPEVGLNAAAGLRIVTPGVRVQEGRMAGRAVSGGGVADAGGLYQTPWPLSEDCLLASYAYARPKCTAPGGADANGFGLYLIDTYGNKELLWREPLLSCSAAIPLRPRRRPPVTAPSRPAGERAATCYVTDVYDGLDGVARGTIKHLRIAQHVGWPLCPQRGAMHYIPGAAHQKQFGYWSWSPVRVIGTVPVRRDGSAHFIVPADTALYFQALDRHHMEVVRMRSMVSLSAGEVRGCRGCHESQARAPAAPARPIALRDPPSRPVPPPWGHARLIGYERVVQPIFDKHCVRCHGGEEPKAGLDFSATRAADGFCRSFHTLFGLRSGPAKRGPALVSCSNRFSNAAVTRPMQFGSHKSRLIQVLLNDARHKERVRLTQAEWIALVTWVDANAPYHEAFFNKRPAAGKPVRAFVPDLRIPFLSAGSVGSSAFRR